MATGTANPTQEVLTTIKSLRQGLDDLRKEVADLRRPASRSGVSPRDVFHAASGPVGKDSEGYSLLRAISYCQGYSPREKAKTEIDVSNRLQEVYSKAGWSSTYGRNSFLVPHGTRYLPEHDDAACRLKEEVRQKMVAHRQSEFDPEEADSIVAKMGPDGQRYWRKAVGTISDAAGGTLVGFPTLGELIDLQRNLEVFPAAGCSEVTLPPNGRFQYPKLTGGAVFGWVGEAGALVPSQQTTGNLDLQAKKGGLLVPINNELLRYASATAEGMIRTDMARQGALGVDLAMLQGTGGTQPLGLVNYPTQSQWVQGSGEKLILRQASVTGTNGDTLQPEDVALMWGALPDTVNEPTAWLFRKSYYPVLMNRRADAAVAGDGKGPFMFWTSRGTASERPPMELWGTKAILSSQVSAGRVKGNASNLTYIILGYFPDWVIGRFGVMEFLATNLSDVAITNDQTLLRGLMFIDGGARHAASFVQIDNLIQA